MRPKNIYALIDDASFTELFLEELGWDKPNQVAMTLNIDGKAYLLTQIAGFRGVRVWACPEVPDRRTQRLLDHEVQKGSDERLLIFHDKAHQEWRWPQSSDERGTGQPRLVTHQHFVGRENPALAQRLDLVSIGIDENPTVVELLKRMRAAFDADRVTKAFYDKFVDQHRALVAALRGIEKQSDREWYGALLMNRLMFIYFMQRKGFMAGDRDYLRNRLDSLQKIAGKGHFYEFYRDFLMPLFHEGLGARSHTIQDPEIVTLIGDVPYINGGIFAVHTLEVANEIVVPDDVFLAVFNLFDRYQWHLDDRPSANPKEINPDVLGYIFEQFINQKEQGAYYTKEDVTHFMTASTLLPVFLSRFENATSVNPWLRLTQEPERYIWESLSYGIAEPLPDEIDFERSRMPRPAWNAQAENTRGLPGESWWEVDARRTRSAEVLALLKSGHITNVDDALSVNIDMESLAVDVIDQLDTPADVVAAWKVLSRLNIIDPTCGSGAFLFAAMKILQLLYGVVLDAAEQHGKTSQNSELHDLLDQSRSHPNREYFILKHATLTNLYGVDLMHEAVEIARLRLFLKLVSTIDRRQDLEPLPDLDFNIKPGNILVGALNVEDIESQSDDLLSQSSAATATESAQRINNEYQTFRTAQESGNDALVKTSRQSLMTLLTTIREDVDRQFHATLANRQSFDSWRTTHVPFHWFIEFPGVMAGGGFDVVIGNPPYVAKRKLTGYAYRGFKTDALPDIFAPCTERASQITALDGRFSLILPISAQFGREFTTLRNVLEARFGNLWVSTFSRNPAALFSAGLGVRSTIVVGAPGDGSAVWTTKTHRWYDDFRPALFETLTYTRLTDATRTVGWVRPTGHEAVQIMDRLISSGGTLGSAVRKRGQGRVRFKTTSLYWLSVFGQDPQSYTLECRPTPQTKIGQLTFETAADAAVALAMLASKLAFVWWYCTGDDFDVTGDGLRSTPIDPGKLSAKAREKLTGAANDLVLDFPNHVAFTKYAGKWMGNYVHSEMRDITDRVDSVLAEEFGYEELLPALEHAYYCVYKPTGERPGTLRYDPCRS